MIRFENLDVLNFDGAIRGMRNSWESWDRSDSFYDDERKTFVLGDDDLSLALRLARAGSDHAKYRRQIIVSVDIIAGNEFFKEFDTYKIGTVANSTSAMHKLGSRFLTANDFSFDRPLSDRAQKTIDDFNEYVRAWWESGKVVGNREWRDMQKAMPMGFVYRRTVTMNYEVLANIYRSRRGHRLAEWREFCEWIETLPYSEIITLKTKDVSSS